MVRQRSAKPLFSGSNPDAASTEIDELPASEVPVAHFFRALLAKIYIKGRDQMAGVVSDTLYIERINHLKK